MNLARTALTTTAIRAHLIDKHGWTFLDIATNTESLELLHQFEHYEASFGLVEMHHDHR